MQKRFHQNLILLFFGIFLRGCVFGYLANHPGERSSIVPSLQILGQKILGWGFRIVGRDPQVLLMKSSLEKDFDELTYMVTNSGSCKDKKLITELDQARKTVNELDYQQVTLQYNYYYQLAMEFKEKLSQTCN